MILFASYSVEKERMKEVAALSALASFLTMNLGSTAREMLEL